MNRRSFADTATIRAADTLEEGFARAWLEAPRSARRFTERDAAQFFYLLGVRDGRNSAAQDLNEDLKEMARIVRERIR